jgi:hypothetical protein
VPLTPTAIESSQKSIVKYKFSTVRYNCGLISLLWAIMGTKPTFIILYLCETKFQTKDVSTNFWNTSRSQPGNFVHWKNVCVVENSHLG